MGKFLWRVRKFLRWSPAHMGFGPPERFFALRSFLTGCLLGALMASIPIMLISMLVNVLQGLPPDNFLLGGWVALGLAAVLGAGFVSLFAVSVPHGMTGLIEETAGAVGELQRYFKKSAVRDDEDFKQVVDKLSSAFSGLAVQADVLGDKTFNIREDDESFNEAVEALRVEFEGLKVAAEEATGLIRERNEQLRVEREGEKARALEVKRLRKLAASDDVVLGEGFVGAVVDIKTASDVLGDLKERSLAEREARKAVEGSEVL